MCGVLRAPVLRALVGASWTASLAMSPGLEIGEQKLRTIGSRNRANRQQKRNPSPLTRIERSYSACPYRFFGPAAPRRPSKTVPRAPPSGQPGASGLSARASPRPPQTRRRKSAPGARVSPHRPLEGMNPAPSPRGTDPPTTPPRSLFLPALPAHPLDIPLIGRRGTCTRRRTVIPQKVALGIRGVLLLLVRGLRRGRPRLPLRACNLA